MWLWHNLHNKNTDKYLHKAEWWESAQEMESRTIKEIYKLLELSKQQAINILLVSHNSISRCLIWNTNWIPSNVWVNNNIWNDEIFSLDEKWDEYTMKEFRKQFRENWIVPWRKNFNWNDFTWENNIEYTENWQIIYYPLFKYSNWNFVAWNNLDKYCSFTEWYLNEIEIKKKAIWIKKKFQYNISTTKEWWNNLRKFKYNRYLC